jgi:hypothetical protein
VSGELRLRGSCGKGCRIRIETLSAAAELELDRRSSFALRFETFSGSLIDKLGVSPSGERDEMSGRLGKAEGRIEAETFSGSLTVRSPAPLGK